MLAKSLRNLKLRNFTKKKELVIIVNKFLFINLISNSFLFKNYSSFDKNLLKLYYNFKIKSIESFCVLSNRKKVINSKFSLSRLVIRDFINFGLVPGYKKSVW